MIPEFLHDAFEPVLVELTVRDRDARFRHEPAHVVGDVRDVVHAVVHEEHLTFPQQLAPNRLRDRALVELADVGEDRLAILGRGVHQREIADTGERHLQRARDRSCGERQHVDVGAPFLDALLVLHAETLFLVDHEQTRRL